MKNKWKIILFAALFIFIIGLVAYESLKGIEASVLEVQPGSIASTFKEEGIVVSGVEQNVFAHYSGEILEITVEEGQQVQTGDLLISLDTKEIDSQLQQLRAQLKSTKGEQSGTYQQPYESQIISQKLLVEQAEREVSVYQGELERMEVLHQAGAVSDKDFQDAQHIAISAKNNLAIQEQALTSLVKSGSGMVQFYQGRVDALQAQIDFLEYQKQKCQVTAAIDGIVGNISVKKGDLAIVGNSLLQVFKPTSYQLEVYLLTADVASVHQGMKVDLISENKDKDQVFQGIIKNIAPSAITKVSPLGLEEQRVKVTITWEDAQGIPVFPNHKIDAEFTTHQKSDVLVVPKTALFPYEEGEAVWLVSGKKAVIRPVQPGFETNRDVVIEEGLAPGDVVILNPQMEGLKEGKKIKSVFTD